jgi:hypothetical protein
VSGTGAAARGFVAVLLAALAFFGFVVASGTLGDLGQATIGIAIAVVVLLYLWSRLDGETRERFLAAARRLLRPAPTEH